MEFDNNYFTVREQAIRWLNRDVSKRDFAQGLSILERMRFKPLLCRRLRMHKESPTTMAILTAALRDGANFYRNPDNPKYADGIPAELEVEESGTHQDVATEADITVSEKKKPGNYPPNVAKVYKWFADAYNLRDRLHRDLRGIGEGNDAQSMARRKDLATRIDNLSARMDRLYMLREAYHDSGIIPTDEQLAELAPNAPAPAAPAPVIEGESSSSLRKKDEDFASMGRDELMRRAHSMKTAITRKRNMLLYQATSKKAKENPMPLCPRRTKIEAQIRILEEKLYHARSCLAKFG